MESAYVALLRGINVGGKAKVDMPTLRAEFEALGATSVSTYINSGNVVFRDGRPADALVPLAERAIERRFGYPVAVQLRDLPAMRDLVEAIPPEWTNDGTQRTDVLFLQPEDDAPLLHEAISPKQGIESGLHLPGALVWNLARENAGRSSLLNMMGTPLYRRLTIRNVNTVRRVRELMERTADRSA